jgi:hypothetical protein
LYKEAPEEHRTLPKPIERGAGGTGLLAHVLVSKYADHCPLYRQSEIYAREGVELERSALADWAPRRLCGFSTDSAKLACLSPLAIASRFCWGPELLSIRPSFSRKPRNAT